jgi:hypothetical protein
VAVRSVPAITIQREVDHDGAQFIGTGVRAGWRIALKRAVIGEYNARTGAGLSLQTDLADELLDRCHKISFSDIENVVVAYLNGAISLPEFVRLTDSVTHDGAQVKQIGKFRSFLYHATTAAEKVTGANNLLAVLNSAIGNVILGNAPTNRSIQEHLDLHFAQTPGGHYSLTPESRSRADAWQGYSSGLAMTPTGEHIKSSSSGSVPKGGLTPGSHSILTGHGLN